MLQSGHCNALWVLWRAIILNICGVEPGACVGDVHAAQGAIAAGLHVFGVCGGFEYVLVVRSVHLQCRSSSASTSPSALPTGNAIISPILNCCSHGPPHLSINSISAW
jgi:hypothetical protein